MGRARNLAVNYGCVFEERRKDEEGGDTLSFL